jgi:peptidoglycan/LPS O-acetylase OafA/YrhL
MNVRVRRGVSIFMAVAAAAWGAFVVHTALQADDGGPPLGAICFALPGFVLLVAAGAVWPKRTEIPRPLEPRRGERM